MRRIEIPKRGALGKTRPLGIPSVYDRVCQQAMVNRLEPIFEEVFDPSSFGYRKGRKTADALSKIWREVEAGNEWIVDADLKDYFGSVDHEKLMALIGKQVADGRVLKLIQQTLTAGYQEEGRQYATPRGTPQGGVISPLLSNILLTPFDKEMRRQGYQLTRWADDWVVTFGLEPKPNMFWLGRQKFSNNSASRSTGTRPELCTWPMGSSFWDLRSNVEKDSSSYPMIGSNPS